MESFIHKLKFKAAAVVLDAPSGLEAAFEEAGCINQVPKGKKAANLIIFVFNQVQLMAFLRQVLQMVEYDGVLWIAYPKGSAGLKADINRDTIRATVEAFAITTVAAIAIDATWSALRLRPIDRVGK